MMAAGGRLIMKGFGSDLALVLGQCALNRHAKGTKWYCFTSCNRQITGGHTSAIAGMKGCGLNSKCKSKFLL